MIDVLDSKNLENTFIKARAFLKNAARFIEKRAIAKCKQIKIGRGSYGFDLDTFRMWESDERIEVGKFCSIARNVRIFGGGEHFFQRVTSYPFKKIDSGFDGKDRSSKGSTIIGNDVWIGEGAIILSGVRVGDGSVIGAGAVVAKDMPPFAIAVGNPAKIIRFRFSDDQIAKLLKIRWWDWEDNKIKDNLHLFENINEFIKKFYEDTIC